MGENLMREDVEEKRAKCAVCGHVLTYPEYIKDNRCVWHSEKRHWQGFVAWIVYSVAEYRVYQLKLAMARAGRTVSDFEACVGQHGEDIGKIQDSKGMNALFKELKGYQCPT